MGKYLSELLQIKERRLVWTGLCGNKARQKKHLSHHNFCLERFRKPFLEKKENEEGEAVMTVPGLARFHASYKHKPGAASPRCLHTEDTFIPKVGTMRRTAGRWGSVGRHTHTHFNLKEFFQPLYQGCVEGAGRTQSVCCLRPSLHAGIR